MPLPEPHGGRLIDGRLEPGEAQTAIQAYRQGELPALQVDDGTAQEIHNITTGLYSPLEGFMGHSDLTACLRTGRLRSGLPWTVPILLLVREGELRRVFGRPTRGEGRRVVLSVEDRPMALMDIQEVFPVDHEEISKGLFGTDSPAHPGVVALGARGEWALAGRVLQIQAVEWPPEMAVLTPRESRRLIAERGWETVVAFQTRNAPHLGHEYCQKTALAFADGLLISPVLGPKKEGDFSDAAIIQGYRALIGHYYPQESVLLGSISYAMRYAGPREAIHHALMRKNLGCSQFIVGRDHAGVGDFYGPYEAQEFFKRFPDLGISPVPFGEFFYCRRCQAVASPKTCPHSGEEIVTFSGTRVRAALVRGEGADLLIRPEVKDALDGVEEAFVTRERALGAGF